MLDKSFIDKSSVMDPFFFPFFFPTPESVFKDSIQSCH